MCTPTRASLWILVGDFSPYLWITLCINRIFRVGTLFRLEIPGYALM